MIKFRTTAVSRKKRLSANAPMQLRRHTGFRKKVPSQLSSRCGFIYLMMLVCSIAFVGCAAHKPNIDQELARAITQNSYPRSIAVLPFGNKTEVHDIEDFVRVTFYSHLCAHPYKDIELQLVDQKLRQHNITDYEKLRKVSVKKLGRILGCDAVVFGEVIEYEKFFVGIYSQIAVGASITIWDTRTGHKIWTDEHTERNHEGGIPLAITDIPMIAIRSGMNLREDAKVEVVDDLSRILTRNIPVPESFNYNYALIRSDSNGKFSKYKSLKRLTKSNDRLVYSTKFKSLKRLTKKDNSGKDPGL